jgi:hypothetical protein
MTRSQQDKLEARSFVELPSKRLSTCEGSVETRLEPLGIPMLLGIRTLGRAEFSTGYPQQIWRIREWLGTITRGTRTARLREGRGT